LPRGRVAGTRRRMSLPAAGTALRWRWGQLRLAIAPWGINVRLLGCVGQDRFGDLLLDNSEKLRGHSRCAAQRSLPHGQFSTSTSHATAKRTFFGSRGANQFCVLHAFPPARFFHQLRRISWVTAFSIRDLKNREARSCASFIHAANGFLSMWDGAEQAIPKNSPTAPR